MSEKSLYKTCAEFAEETHVGERERERLMGKKKIYEGNGKTERERQRQRQRERQREAKIERDIECSRMKKEFKR